jgi:hypothetical protein
MPTVTLRPSSHLPYPLGPTRSQPTSTQPLQNTPRRRDGRCGSGHPRAIDTRCSRGDGVPSPRHASPAPASARPGTCHAAPHRCLPASTTRRLHAIPAPSPSGLGTSGGLGLMRAGAALLAALLAAGGGRGSEGMVVGDAVDWLGRRNAAEVCGPLLVRPSSFRRPSRRPAPARSLHRRPLQRGSGVRGVGPGRDCVLEAVGSAGCCCEGAAA